MNLADKVRENKARRMATRQRLRLVKSRRRDPRAYDFGRYWLIVSETSRHAFGDMDGASLEAIEHYLNGQDGRR